MNIAASALILLARRYSELAKDMAVHESNPKRAKELEEISIACAHVPEYPASSFLEAVQMYWFMHIGVTLESNSDAFGPGFIDLYLQPFYCRDIVSGTLTKARAREILECLFIKMYSHYTTPTFLDENATFVYFCNVQLGGDNPNELSVLILDILDDLHLFQPLVQVFISSNTPDWFLSRVCRAIRKGTGYPAVFNLDSIRAQLVDQGISKDDAQSSAGVVGCVETICIGKECLFTVGYLNSVKPLELALNNGVDPLSGLQIGPLTGNPLTFHSVEDLLQAYDKQLSFMVNVKCEMDWQIEQACASRYPTPLRSYLISGCIQSGKLLEEGGAKYNTSAIAATAFGTVVDSITAIANSVFGEFCCLTMEEVLQALRTNYQGENNERVRQILASQPKWGNNMQLVDAIALRVKRILHNVIEGRSNYRGGKYHVEFLSVTSHICFGEKTGATPDG